MRKALPDMRANKRKRGLATHSLVYICGMSFRSPPRACILLIAQTALTSFEELAPRVL